MSMTFNDSNGKTWSCRFRVSDAQRLKEAGKDIFNPENYEKYFSSSLDFIEIISDLLRPQWEAEKMTYTDFVDLITDTPKVFEDAMNAFLEALSDFFQRLGSPAITEVINKSKRVAKMKQEAILAKVQDPRIEKLLQREVNKELEAIDAKLEKLTLEG